MSNISPFVRSLGHSRQHGATMSGMVGRTPAGMTNISALILLPLNKAGWTLGVHVRPLLWSGLVHDAPLSWSAVVHDGGVVMPVGRGFELRAKRATYALRSPRFLTEVAEAAGDGTATLFRFPEFSTKFGEKV